MKMKMMMMMTMMMINQGKQTVNQNQGTQEGYGTICAAVKLTVSTTCAFGSMKKFLAMLFSAQKVIIQLLWSNSSLMINASLTAKQFGPDSAR